MNKEVKRLLAEEREKRTRKLNLTDQKLMAIPVELESMDWLTTLNISENQLSKLENLPPQLTILNININRVEKLENLPSQLTTLYISSNRISKLENLPSRLTTLYISINKISKLENLPPQLRTLYIRRNWIEKLENLPMNLKILYIDSNRISKLENLPLRLTAFDIHKNQLVDISNFWVDILSSKLKLVWKKKWYDVVHGELNLFDNPLEIPTPEIIQQGHDAVVRYMAELKKGEEKIMESRLLIVGQGGAGKTSLKRKLIDSDADLPDEVLDSTRGIEVDILPLKTAIGEDFKLNIWDFGGQNIQHYAHQFFLSGSCLYALVHNQRTQNTNFQYWLNIIEMLGKSSPVLVVQNEIAGHVEPIENAALIKDRFNNVLSPFHQTNLLEAASDSRFATLKEAITAIASNPNLLPHFGQVRPASFVHIREALEKEKAKAQFIEWQKYEEICRANGVSDENLMRDYLNTFNFLGDSIHFEGDLELRNLIFLHPKWIIDALFKLLYHEKVVKQNGLFSEMDSLEIWKDKKYGTLRGKLIRLMENFQLCYPVEGGEKKKYIVPQRLQPMDEKFPWDEPESVRVVFAYKFMPKGIITRLTCRLYQDIEKSHVWNDALILAQKNIGRILIRERYAEDEIWIEAAGKQKSNLMNLVVKTVNEIHEESKFTNLQVELKLPCICKACLGQDNPHYFEYRDVVDSIKEGDETLKCKDSRHRMDLRKLLAYFFENGDQEPAYVEEFRRAHERNIAMHELGYKMQELSYNKLLALDTLVKSLPVALQQELIFVQNNFNQLNLPEAQMKMWLAEIKAAVATLPAENEWKQKYLEIAESQDAQIEAKGALELTLPIIPGILTYKGELNTGFQTKLKDIWDDLKRPFKK